MSQGGTEGKPSVVAARLAGPGNLWVAVAPIGVPPQTDWCVALPQVEIAAARASD